MNIKDKVVLITGASAGIGKATAELFHACGARVALAARSLDLLEALASALPGAIAIRADMTLPADIHRMVKQTHDHFGRLDVLINNAGQGMQAPLEHIDLDDFAKIMTLNVYGPLRAMQAAIPLMRQQGGGAIVNISSMLSKMAIPGLSAYASTKSALNMLSLTARAELAADGIVVSVVCPGLTATDFRQRAIQSKVKVEIKRPAFQMPEADPVEKVAVKILEAVETGVAEIELR